MLQVSWWVADALPLTVDQRLTLLESSVHGVLALVETLGEMILATENMMAADGTEHCYPCVANLQASHTGAAPASEDIN